MKFAEKLNIKKIEFPFNKIEWKPSINKETTIQQIIENIKRQCIYKRDERHLKGYLYNDYYQENGTSSLGEIYEGWIDPFPSRLDTSSRDFMVQKFSRSLRGISKKYSYEPTPYGIFSIEDAELLEDKLKIALEELGFQNIQIKIIPTPMKEAISVKRRLLSYHTYSIKYRDTGETGYKVFISFDW